MQLKIIILVLSAATTFAVSAGVNITSNDRIRFERSLRAFSAAMYWKISQPHNVSENILFSPASISQTMGMVMAGANGDTLFQMRRALRMKDFMKPELNALYKGSFMDKFEETKSPVITLMASRAFIQKNYTIYENYTQIMEENYFATSEEVDFLQKEMASDRINAWVNEQTRGLIPDILKPNHIGALTRFVLVNALYFKASWFGRFSEFGKRNFTTPTETAEVPFINGKGSMKRLETASQLYMAIPYKDGKTYFTIIMPKTDKAMKNFSNRTHIETYFRNFKRKIMGWPERQISLLMPEFTFGQDLDVKKVLRAMYVKDVFEPNLADLRGISGEDVYISDFLHKAKITVNENGTEAAATSAAISTARALISYELIEINRPFIFAIYQKGSILFMGRMVDPRKK